MGDNLLVQQQDSKLCITEIDFDNATLEELKEIRKEIDDIIIYKETLKNRLKIFDDKLKIEKNNKKQAMLKEIEDEIAKEKKKLLKIRKIEEDEETEEEEEEEEEAIIYNKKTPKGKPAKRGRPKKQ